MTWTDDQWAMFGSIIKRGFAAKEPFTPKDDNVYRLLLDGVEPGAALAAVRELVLEGQALRPRPGEIVARARRDPGRPTFDEAYRLIFGAGGVLSARPSGPLRYDSERDRQRQINEAATQRAAEMHPLIGAFVTRQGIDRLRSLPLAGPGEGREDYSELRRKELREAWEKHVAMFDGRELAALATGDSARAGLRRFDPLAALGMTVGTPALEVGEATA